MMEARGGMNYFHNEALVRRRRAEDRGGGRHPRREHRRVDERHDADRLRHRTEPEQSAGRLSRRACRGIAPSGRCSSPRCSRKSPGNHTIKFGEDFRHTRDFLLQTQDNGGPRGQFQFRAPQTAIPSDAAATGGFANAFASFLLDVPSLVQRDLKVTDPGVRFWAFFTFIQDKWAVTPKLTIDLGLRHEYYTPFIGLADQGGLSNYDPATNTLQVAGYGDVGAERRRARST